MAAIKQIASIKLMRGPLSDLFVYFRRRIRFQVVHGTKKPNHEEEIPPQPRVNQ